MKDRSLSRREANPSRGGLVQSSDLFEDMLAPFGGWLSRMGMGEGRWMPPVNIEESDEAYLVSAELPGLKKEDLDITVENNILTLSGERKWAVEEGKTRQLHRVERGYGRFTRSFVLPRRVSAEQVKARFEDGLLEVTIPKDEAARPRKIDIS